MNSRTALAAGLGVLLAVVAACEVPTDKSGGLTVQLDPLPPLIVDDTMTLSARVMSEADSIPNAAIRYTADDESVLSVDPGGQLLAVGSGTVTVTATALTYAQALPASETIRVKDVYELDSISPSLVRFGDVIDLYGVGLTQTVAVTIGGADAIAESYTPADPENRNRFGLLSIYATPPAPQVSQVVLLGFEGILISDTIGVIQRDLYEPNDTTPRNLTPPISNPALAFERVRRGDGRLAVDWYTFTTTEANDWTISAWSPAGGARFKVYVTNSLFWSGALLETEGVGLYGVGPGDWGVGTSFRPCGGSGMYFPGFDEWAYTFEVPPDSAIIPLGGLPAGTYNVFVTYGEGSPFYDEPSGTAAVGVFVDSLNLAQPLRAGLEIRQGYHSLLEKDALEENDYCDVASSITVPGRIEKLTIDSPHDADWYRFRIDTAQRLQFNVETTGDLADFADLDTYVVRDLRPDSLVVVDFSGGADAAATAAVELEPGNYFVVVVDFLGVPTEYTLTSELVNAPPVSGTGMQVLLDEKRHRAGVVGGVLKRENPGGR